MSASLSRRFLNHARTLGVHGVVRAMGHNLLAQGFDRVPANGMRFRVPPTMDGVVYAALWLGRYEYSETRLLRAHFNHDHTIFDIGANIGFVSTVAYREKLLPGGHLICVEANPDVQACLSDNMRAAHAQQPGADKTCTIIEAALADRSAEGADFVKLRNLGSHVLNGRAPEAEASLIHVNTVDMDALVRAHAPSGYSLICDIEGGEVALFTAEKALKTCRQMMIELHPAALQSAGTSVDEAVARFKAMGFMPGARHDDNFVFTRAPS